mgnify:CR=1 FL=1
MWFSFSFDALGRLFFKENCKHFHSGIYLMEFTKPFYLFVFLDLRTSFFTFLQSFQRRFSFFLIFSILILFVLFQRSFKLFSVWIILLPSNYEWRKNNANVCHQVAPHVVFCRLEWSAICWQVRETIAYLLRNLFLFHLKPTILLGF